MSDFNTRLYQNQLEGLEPHIGPYTFSSTIDDDLLPHNNLSFFLTEFIQDNELCVVSSMRKRPPSKLVTYLEITRDPPPFSSPTIDTYAALDHVLCRMEHQHCFCSILSLPHLALPWHHRHFLISAIVPLPFFHSPKPPPPPPKRDFSSNDSKLAYQPVVLSAFGLPSPPSNNFAPFHIYTDGSCPDQSNISPHNPAALGVFYESIFLDLYGPVGSLHSQSMDATTPLNSRHRWKPSTISAAALQEVIDPSHLPTRSANFMPVWSSNASPTLLTNISIHTNMVFARIDLSPLLYFSSAISPNVLKGTPPLYTSFFLDRPQASDPIGHPAAALQRYVVPPLLVQAIMALYHNGQFFVSDLSFHSPQYTFRRGIWQGCPLSP